MVSEKGSAPYYGDRQGPTRSGRELRRVGEDDENLEGRFSPSDTVAMEAPTQRTDRGTVVMNASELSSDGQEARHDLVQVSESTNDSRAERRDHIQEYRDGVEDFYKKAEAVLGALDDVVTKYAEEHRAWAVGEILKQGGVFSQYNEVNARLTGLERNAKRSLAGQMEADANQQRIQSYREEIDKRIVGVQKQFSIEAA